MSRNPSDNVTRAWTRLMRARQQLLNAGPERTITDVALSSGFSQLGRFSAEYRSSFGELPSENLASLRTGQIAERFVTQSLLDRPVGSDFQLPPTDRPPPSFLEQRTAAVLPFLASHTRTILSSRWLFVPL